MGRPVRSSARKNPAHEPRREGLDSSELAEAFPFTDLSAGTAASISVYVDAGNRHEGHGWRVHRQRRPPRVTRDLGVIVVSEECRVEQPLGESGRGERRQVLVRMLGRGGTLNFHDRPSGSCVSENSAQSTLTAMPATWWSGTEWPSCPVSAYVSGGAAPQSQPTAPADNSTSVRSLTQFLNDRFANGYMTHTDSNERDGEVRCRLERLLYLRGAAFEFVAA
jgi:hypothetical protein